MKHVERTAKRQFEYDRAYMKMAEAIAELSYAERKKVGAIIVSRDDQVISQGFNGTPHGWDNCCEVKDADGNLHTIKEVLHAEANAITKCAKYMASTEGATLYVTLSPCIDCAKLIVQSDIKRVVFRHAYRSLDGVLFLKECGVHVQQIVMESDSAAMPRYIEDVNEMVLI